MTFMTLFVVFFGVVCIPTSAVASVQSSWSSLGYQVYDVEVGPDNMPRAVSCNLGGSIRGYNQYGNLEYTIEAQEPSEIVEVGCGTNISSPTVRPTDSISASGNTAVLVDAYDSDYVGDTIRLYDNSGVLEWEETPLDGCASNRLQITHAPIVTGGVVVFAYMSCSSYGQYYLMGLSESDGSVEFNISIGSTIDASSRLGWYEGGFYYSSGGQYFYFSSTGVEDVSRGYFVGYASTTLAEGADGSLVYWTHDEDDWSTCYLVFHVYGDSDTSRLVDCGAQFSDPELLPNGDLVTITANGDSENPGIITLYPSDGISTPTTQGIFKLDYEGYSNFVLMRLVVDADGNVLARYTFQETTDDGTYVRAGFDIFDSGLSNKLMTWSSSRNEDVQVYGEPGVALANGAVYILDGLNARMYSVRAPMLSIGHVDSDRWQLASYTHESSSYVAMGDSYSAGTGSYNPDLDEDCHRSTDTYSYYVSENSTVPAISTPDLVACHGAVTDDIVGLSGQVSALGEDTDYVSITIGGNDAGFESVLTACTAKLYDIGYGCSVDGDVVLPLASRLAALSGGVSALEPKSGKPIHSIQEVLGEIIEAAPGAKVYIAGYPHLFGDSTIGYQSDVLAPGGYHCDINDMAYGAVARVSYDDAQWLNGRADALNEIISDAVDYWHDSEGKDVFYVDSAAVFSGHGLCDSGGSWITPVTNIVESSPLSELDSESIHPTIQGYSNGYGAAFLAEMN